MNFGDQARTRFGRVVSALAVIGASISLALVAIFGGWRIFVEEFGLHAALEAIGLGLIAWVAIAAQPRNGAVWALGWAAFFSMLQSFGAFGSAASETGGNMMDPTTTAPADLPFGAAVAQQTLEWVWIPGIFLLTTTFFLLFPDGIPLSRRWRRFTWLCLGVIVFSSAAIAWTFRPSSTVLYETQETTDPITTLGFLALLLLLPASVVAVVSLVVRYRRGTSEVRRQIRWIAWGGSVLVAALITLVLFEGSAGGVSPAGLIALGGALILIGSIGVSITKYRLYDIDLVISRTVTYGALALFITAVYVAIVVGIGSLVGQGEEPNLALAIVATATVALLFEPLRFWLQQWANRLSYGDRATPYSVLSEISNRFADTDSSGEALQRLVDLLASGTGAEHAVVWLRVGDRLRPEAVSRDPWPAPVALEGRAISDMPGDASEPILHGAELLGALTISKERGQPVTPADQQLLEDVAAGAGLLLRNIRLNAELADRAEELRSSRRRLVATQDAERRRLERNLHDGAQQQVVALKVKLGLARTMAERENVDEIAAAVGGLADDAQRAVDGMRAAARGIYPPLLEAEGIRAALVAASRDLNTTVAVDADMLGRYPAEVEATVYFTVLAALSPGARVAITEHDADLRFEIENAEPGPGMPTVADRVDALGGTLDLYSAPNGGQSIVGQIPVTALEVV